jgi:hypothetical protein
VSAARRLINVSRSSGRWIVVRIIKTYQSIALMATAQNTAARPTLPST